MRRQVPLSTYRIQFTPQFRFVDCRDLVPYLHELGVGAIYSSPRFRANRGSAHGYDVANPARINSELGSEEEFEDLCQRLRQYGMGLVLDIVPNHMAASQENGWWMDVLEHGQASAYAHFFDIDWAPATTKASFLEDGKVLLPVLGDLYGNVLEAGQFGLRFDEQGFFVQYYERRLPLDPSSYGLVFDFCMGELEAALGGEGALAEVRAMVEQLPPRTVVEAGERAARMAGAEAIKCAIFTLYREHLEFRLALDEALRRMSNRADSLHELLERQVHRLAHWKIAFEEINYRRFFDINDLVCLRVEAQDVFEARHESILRLVEEGKVTGLRVDHVDGLLDPAEYLTRLREYAGRVQAGPPLFVVVEKILGRGEPLPEGWQVHGTTGYDFLNAMNDLFLAPDGVRALDEAWVRFTGEERTFEEILYASNKQVMWKLFAGEVSVFGHHLGRLSALDRHGRDVPQAELMSAFVEVTACLPVYRTYITSGEIEARDRAVLERTLELARRRTSAVAISDAAFAFLRSILLLEPPAYLPELKAVYLRFVMKWQQFTGPVMAKGSEDTAGYVFNSLISRNEVGADPIREAAPMSRGEFHEFNRRRLERWPDSMSATATHDTKRSEDVRARLNVLSELAGEWEKLLKRWSGWNRSRKTEHLGRLVPAPGEEILLYQAMLGSWPVEPPLGDGEAEALAGRLKEFAVKAIREAKVNSGWISPDAVHEAAVAKFLDGILTVERSNRFYFDFLRFQAKLAWHGAINSLAMVVIKTTAPGVPDFYQGTELWDWSLVDPDNRRPVDYRQRVAALEQLRREAARGRAALPARLMRNWTDGRVKMFVTDKALDFRRQHHELYLEGAYEPVEVTGKWAEHVVAFARRRGGEWALTVTARWTAKTGWGGARRWKPEWGDTALVLGEGAPGEWRNVFSGETVAAARRGGAGVIAVELLLGQFPVALMDGTASV